MWRLAAAFLLCALLLTTSPLRAGEAAQPRPPGKEVDVGRTLILLPSKLIRAPLGVLKTGLRHGLNFVEEERLADKLDYYLRWLEGEGVYPKVFELGDGSGVGAALEVRRSPGGPLCLGLAAGVTHKLYQGYQAQAALPLAGGRLELTTRAGYLYRPEEEFFGLGPDTTEATQSNYLLEDGYLEAMARAGGAGGPGGPRRLQVGAAVRFDAYKASPGKATGEPSVEQVFTRAEVPGLLGSVDLLSTGVAVVHDSRDWLDLPTRGGRRRLAAALFHDTSGGRFDFWRASLELEQLLPKISTARHAFLVRFWGEMNEPLSDSDEVPFFLLAKLGGSRWLRGFHELRFYDQHALTWSLEYRYRIWGRADAFLYVDQGEAFGRDQGFTLGDIATSGGGGVMLRAFGLAHTEDVISGGPDYIAVRERLFFMLLLGASGEGLRPFVTFGAFL